MASTDDSPEGEEQSAPAPTPPRRGPGHRGQDVRDTMAEMAAKAHEISLEAGSRMAGTMREVVGAAAGLTPFAIESARDLVQYMVRRGQMSQDEADKLMREVEIAHATSPRPLLKQDAPKAESARKGAVAATASPVAPPPVVVIDVEPPVVPRPMRAVTPDSVDDDDDDSFSAPELDDDADTETDDTLVKSSAPAKTPTSTPAPAPAPKTAGTTAKSAPSRGTHAPAPKSPKVSAPKPAAKSAAKAPAKAAAKPVAKKGAKVAAKPPARKSAPPKKK